MDAASGPSSFLEPLVELKPALATCPCGHWAWSDLPAIGSIGWHGVPVKCPKCKIHYLILVHVRIHHGHLQADVVAHRRVRLAGAVGIQRALQPLPPGMTAADVEFIAAVSRLLGESAA
jgi:hypothetical protein